MSRRGRRVAPGDAAHPIAAAWCLFGAWGCMSMTLGVLVAEWRWSWLTTVLGSLAVALAVLMAVCLIPRTEDDPEEHPTAGVPIPMPPGLPLGEWVRVETEVRDGVVSQTVHPIGGDQS